MSMWIYFCRQQFFALLSEKGYPWIQKDVRELDMKFAKNLAYDQPYRYKLRVKVLNNFAS